jgi:S-adenosylhomocysteine hydrolase
MYLTKDKSGLYIVADISLADAGEKRVAWARS